jgi:hypothetical protein
LYYEQIGPAACLDQFRADEIMRAARPHIEALLLPEPEGGVRVSAHLVGAAEARVADP